VIPELTAGVAWYIPQFPPKLEHVALPAVPITSASTVTTGLWLATMACADCACGVFSTVLYTSTRGRPTIGTAFTVARPGSVSDSLPETVFAASGALLARWAPSTTPRKRAGGLR